MDVEKAIRLLECINSNNHSGDNYSVNENKSLLTPSVEMELDIFLTNWIENNNDNIENRIVASLLNRIRLGGTYPLAEQRKLLPKEIKPNHRPIRNTSANIATLMHVREFGGNSAAKAFRIDPKTVRDRIKVVCNLVGYSKEQLFDKNNGIYEMFEPIFESHKEAFEKELEKKKGGKCSK